MNDCGAGDAPAQYDSDACLVAASPPCSTSGDTLTCDFDGCASGVEMWAVNYASGTTISVFGRCLGLVPQEFCCVVEDSGGEILVTDAFGSDEGDKLNLLHTASNKFLAATGVKMTANLTARGGNDTILGSRAVSSYEETLMGNGGDDWFNANEGADRVYGGTGADDLYGGPGADTLHGEDGDDDIWGGTENDKIYAGNHNDVVFGEGGADQIWGGNGVDVLRGGDQNDTIYGGASMDSIYGEGGNDTLFGQDGIDWMYGGAGDDKLHGGNSSDILNGDADDDVLYGGEAYDELYGGTDDDTLCDTHGWGSQACPGEIYFSGGTGTDTAYFEGGFWNGAMYCANTVLSGDDTVETASHENRNWSAVLYPGGTETTAAEPAACTDLRAAGGN